MTNTFCEFCAKIFYKIITLTSFLALPRVAYTAQTRECLLNGLESFLHELTVLPPGKWDPAIRFERQHLPDYPHFT
jgi:hypothetical protein